MLTTTLHVLTNQVSEGSLQMVTYFTGFSTFILSGSTTNYSILSIVKFCDTNCYRNALLANAPLAKHICSLVLYCSVQRGIIKGAFLPCSLNIRRVKDRRWDLLKSFMMLVFTQQLKSDQRDVNTVRLEDSR